MVEKEYTDEEIEELDSFLQYKFNHDIYEELNGVEYDDYEDLFEPLELFRLLHLKIDLIDKNAIRPMYIAQNLKTLPFNDMQLDYFYSKLIKYYSIHNNSNEQVNICCREISKLQENLDVYAKDEEIETSEQKEVFVEVLEHLETFSTVKEKLAYLYHKEAEFKQGESPGVIYLGAKTPAVKCQLEIDKFEKLMRLEATPKQLTDGIKRHKDLTLDRATLLLNYLFTYAKTNCHNTKKAEFIAFLTGYSKNTIGDKFSALHSKADKNFIDYEKDMKIVRKYFENLGLSEIVEMINRDLKI